MGRWPDVRRRVRTAVRAALVGVVVAGGATLTAQAQAQSPDPGRVRVSGSIRSRLEASDWYGDDRTGRDFFSGTIARVAALQSRPRLDWQVELAVPILVGLPDQGVRPAPQGALGLGATYFAANDGATSTASLFAKQAFLRLKRLGGVDAQSLTIGRMEFVDGAEVTPGHATLASLKRDRIAHRLLGTFVFTHVGRSLDGIRYVLDQPRFNVTAVAARPTEGVFQVDGWGELNVAVLYGAATRRVGSGGANGEWRLFGLGYADRRQNPVKVDNRPAAARRLDADRITIGTVGGHYLHAAETAAGAIDLVGWGALQTGSWGVLDHRAASYSIEAGWQPAIWQAVAPWVRGGFAYGSGDDDPDDGRHRTFFQVLPTPRIYARFPFYNLMNIRDGFVELRLRPSPRAVLRGDVHRLRLADSRDLWYLGGGAFQPSTFGYVGRPSNGYSSLATLYDLSADITINRQASVSAYVSYASGHAITRAIYAGSRRATFGYLELLLRF